MRRPATCVSMALGALCLSAAGAYALAPDDVTSMFIGPRSPAGGAPFATALADFDADGHLDVAVSCQTDDAIALLFGSGDGRLGAPQLVPVGDAPRGLVTADFDGDSAADLAVTLLDSDDVVVLLGQGDGSFATPIVVPVGDGPGLLAVGFMDGDAIPDLVVGNLTADTISVLLGAGNGGFTVAATVASGTGNTDIALADVDLDGLTDVLVTDADGPAVAVLLGLGGGALALPQLYTTWGSPSGVAVADFDGDGLPDMAISSGLADGFGPHGLEVRRGTGGGGFGPVVASLQTPSTDVHAADIDGDLDSDLLLVTKQGLLLSLRNLGNGSFNQAAFTPVGPSQQGLSLGDLDRDGLDDVVVASATSGDVLALRGTGGGAFEKSPVGSSGGHYASAMALADVDADGRLDAVVTHDLEDNVAVRLGQGDGGFGPPIASATSSTDPRLLGAGDLNGDGFADVVLKAITAQTPILQIRRGLGDGSFVALDSFSVVGLVSTGRLVDLDGDTDLDLVLTVSDVGVIRAFKNDGTGHLTALFSKPVGGTPKGFDVADLDGDGHLDLIVAVTSSNQLSIVKGAGGGAFANAVPLPTVSSASSVTVVDLDEDGLSDLVVRASSGLHVHRGLGGGAFDPTPQPVAVPGGSNWTLSFLFEDMDGDGHRDLVTKHSFYDSLQVSLGLGGGAFGATTRFAVYPGSNFLAAAQLDGDQATDLVLHDTAGFLSVLLNGADHPWHDLGHALAGSGGTPHLAGEGTLESGSPMSIALSGAAPATNSTLIVGVTALMAPLKGGVLVPMPVLLLPGLPTGPSGGYTLSATWPALPSGFEVFLQVWITDPSGPAGLTASNGLRATTP